MLHRTGKTQTSVGRLGRAKCVRRSHFFFIFFFSFESMRLIYVLDAYGFFFRIYSINTQFAFFFFCYSANNLFFLSRCGFLNTGVFLLKCFLFIHYTFGTIVLSKKKKFCDDKLHEPPKSRGATDLCKRQKNPSLCCLTLRECYPCVIYHCFFFVICNNII